MKGDVTYSSSYQIPVRMFYSPCKVCYNDFSSVAGQCKGHDMAGQDSIPSGGDWKFEPLTLGIKSVNKQIACEPFVKKQVEAKTVGGLVMPGQKITLAELKVVFGNEEFPTGCTVFVPAEGCSMIWGKREYEIEGAKFILVPVDQVILVKRC